MKAKKIRKGLTCNGPGCPLCTKEGIALMLVGFGLMLLLPGRLSYIGLVVLLSAYLLPSIKRIQGEKK
ncbi:hypothetical protein COV93_07575 [Candidatus Woesearchaeota archaeon CG11_big_fil_rev_8_21_14_0_20_43_8]|nr:MAG: hypothetical protein COV93_07575 [Candidatus Woesearchaeota archaeon CG11_big_fil_rev_8_21_14_0_20_43_8]